MTFLIISSILIIIAWLYISASKSHNKSKKIEAQFKGMGYKYFYIGYGSNYIAIDNINKRIKIGNKDTNFQMDLKYSDIIEYKYNWDYENISPYDSSKNHNEFVFLIRNPDYPMHSIRYGAAYKWAEKDWAQIRSVFASNK